MSYEGFTFKTLFHWILLLNIDEADEYDDIKYLFFKTLLWWMLP